MTIPNVGLFADKGAPTASWTRDGIDLPVGTNYAGEITKLDIREAREYEDNTKTALWPDGKIKYVRIATLATDQRDPDRAGDDGHRALYVTDGTQMKTTIMDAVRASGAPEWEVGGVLSVTFAGYDKPRKPGARAPRRFEATYRPPTEAKRAEIATRTATPEPAVADDDPWNDPPTNRPADPWGAAPAQTNLTDGLDSLTPEAKAALLTRLQQQG